MEKHSQKRSFELVLFLVLAIVASLLVYDKMIVFSVTALFAVIVFFLAEGYRVPVEDRSIMWKLALGALLVRIIFIILTQMFDNPFMTNDCITYGRIGNEMAQTWYGGGRYIFNTLNYGYYYFNAFIYYVTGFYPDLVRLVNSIIAVGAALNLYFISLKLSGRKAAKFTFVLTAFFPSFVVWSALNLKESLCIFLITFVVKKTMEMMQEFRVGKLIAIALALLPLVAIRFYLGILLGVVIVMAFIISAVNFKWSYRLFYTMLMALVIGISLLQMGYGFMGIDYLFSQNIETIEEQHNAGAIGDSAYSGEIKFNSHWDVIKYLPVGLFYFFFGPLPWQPGGVLKMLSLPEMFILYILYLFFIPGILSLWRHRRGECLLVLIVISSITLVYALGGSNMGGIYRVRFQVLSLVFLLTSHGMMGQKQYKLSQFSQNQVGLRSE